MNKEKIIKDLIEDMVEVSDTTLLDELADRWESTEWTSEELYDRIRDIVISDRTRWFEDLCYDAWYIEWYKDALNIEDKEDKEERIRYIGKENYTYSIDWIPIHDNIFQNEIYQFDIRDRENQIEMLISWISESHKDIQLMIDDLKYLINIKDKFIFSSLETNEYISLSDDEYDWICKDILAINESINDKWELVKHINEII